MMQGGAVKKLYGVAFMGAGALAAVWVRGDGKVTIHCGTPKLGGRNLDEMIKPGVAWFMGMNNPTTLETSVALDFGGKKLAPGKYAIFARPDEQKNWTFLVSSAIKRPLDPL